MSDSTTLPRPPQVTLAGWITVAGSIFVLVSVFDVISNNRTIETRERVLDALSEPPLSGAGVSLQQALDFLHVTALVAAACATAAAILGAYALQRSKSARLALTVVAPLLFLSGMVTGGFMSSMVAVAAVMLWTAPSRDWFNGIAQRRPDAGPGSADASTGSGRTQSSGPRAFVGFGTPKGSSAEKSGQAPDAGQTDGGPSAYSSEPGQQRPALPSGRPREVLQACLLTWVFSGLVLLVMGVAALAFATSPDLIRDVYESDDRFADVNVDLDQLRAASLVVAGLFSVWALIAVVLAGFTFIGHNWARVTLIISASVAGLLGLGMAFAAPMVLLVTVAAVLVVVMLTRGRSNDWFLSRSRRHL